MTSKRPFGKSVIEPCGARIGVIQAGDVDAAEPGSNGPDRQEDEALGDSVLTEFPSVVDAAQCAISVQ
jgi:hypothetical protein